MRGEKIDATAKNMPGTKQINFHKKEGFFSLSGKIKEK